MQGRILDYSEEENQGVITGDDGKRYSFYANEWKGENAPVIGQQVDFDVNEDGNAVAIYAALGATSSSSSFDPKAIISGVDTKNRSDYNIIDWYILGIKKFADFSGRAERQEFWFYVLAYIIIIAVLSILGGVLVSLFSLASLLPNIAIGTRRLHDIGKSGWWQLLGFIPLVGLIILIIWYAKAGDKGDNIYGSDPIVRQELQ